MGVDVSVGVSTVCALVTDSLGVGEGLYVFDSMAVAVLTSTGKAVCVGVADAIGACVGVPVGIAGGGTIVIATVGMASVSVSVGAKGVAAVELITVCASSSA